MIENGLVKQAVDEQADQRQSKDENVYKLMFEQSALPGLIFDRDGTILIINKALEKLYGAPMVRFIERRSIEDLFHQRNRKRIIDFYRQVSPQDRKSLQVIFQCENGEERIVDLKIQLIENSHLHNAALVDLTEYKGYERRVQELVDRVSVINETVAAINSNLNKDQLIRIFINQMGKIFGYDLVCIALSDIDGKEVEVHISREISELISQKCPGVLYRSLIEELSSCREVEQSRTAVYKIAGILGLKIEENYKSQILIQLKTDDQSIGTVLLFSKGQNAINQYHINIFEEVAGQVAIAFMKARLLQKYQQSLTSLSFLARINESLSSSLDLDIILKQVVESSLQIIHAKICTIHFLETEEKITGTYIKGYDDHFIDRFKPQIQNVIINQKPLMVENIDYNNIQFFQSRMDIQKLGLKSVIILPVKANGKTIALLSVFGDKIHYFSDQETELLSMLADQAAIAILNAQLYQKLENTKNYLESIINSSTHIIVSTDLEGTVTFFNNSAYRLTGFSPEEVLNQPFFTRFIKNGEILYPGINKDLFSKQKILTFECEILTKLNGTLHISWSFSPLVDQHGDVIGALGIGIKQSKQGNRRRNIPLSAKSSITS